MNAHYLHLLTNHLPVAALLFGLVLFAYGAARGRDGSERLGLWFIVAAGLLAIPVLLTGEGAEETVEHLPGIVRADRRLIHQHEDAAEVAFWVLQLAALGAIAGRFTQGPWEGVYRWLRGGVLLLGLVALGLMGRAAQLGGQIRRPELRADYVAPAPTAGGEPHDNKEEEGREREPKKGEAGESDH